MQPQKFNHIHKFYICKNPLPFLHVDPSCANFCVCCSTQHLQRAYHHNQCNKHALLDNSGLSHAYNPHMVATWNVLHLSSKHTIDKAYSNSNLGDGEISQPRFLLRADCCCWQTQPITFDHNTRKRHAWVHPLHLSSSFGETTRWKDVRSHPSNTEPPFLR